jgi:hypothetical protein
MSNFRNKKIPMAKKIITANVSQFKISYKQVSISNQNKTMRKKKYNLLLPYFFPYILKIKNIELFNNLLNYMFAILNIICIYLNKFFF